MGFWRGLGIFAVVSACGRVGFDPLGHATDATSVDAAPRACAVDADCLGCGTCDGQFCVAQVFARISLGHQSTFGIDATGTLWVWGNNDYDELGIAPSGPGNDHLLPTKHPTLMNDVSLLAVGRSEHAAVRGDGSLWRWGGAGTAPFLATASGGWVEIASEGVFGCGRKTNNSLWCWGINNHGELGLAIDAANHVPTQVGAATDWASFGPGYAHVCAIKTDGRLFCWGEGAGGKLGLGASADVVTPTQVGVATDWAQVSGAGDYTCAIKTDHTLWCWGVAPENGQPMTNNMPARVGTDADWRSVHAHWTHSCADKLDGSVYCWGSNTEHQLGLPMVSGSTSTPTALGIKTDELLVGGHHQAARIGGVWWFWGWNAQGEMGDGTTLDRESATPRCP